MNECVNGDRPSPSFFIVGAPKAGTSSLYSYLGEHPDIFLTKQKELHYWSCDSLSKAKKGPGDDLALKNILNDYNEYLSLFSDATDQQVAGDVSPSYLIFCDEVIEKLKSSYSNNDLKIIITLRDPILRAYSQFLHQKRLTFEDLDFVDALNNENVRKSKGYGDFWMYSEHSIYFERCQKFIKAFGRENVEIILFEDIRDQPTKVVRNIFEFLEVDNDFLPKELNVIHNKGGAYKNSFLTNMFLKPSRIKSVFHKCLSPSIIEIYRSLKHKILMKNAIEIEPISNDVRESLRKVFLDDVKKIRNQLKIDVSKWGEYEN